MQLMETISHLEALLFDLKNIRCEIEICPEKSIEWLDGLIEMLEEDMEDQEKNND
jgi:hypothetical protein